MKKFIILVFAVFSLQSCISIRIKTDVGTSKENFLNADYSNIIVLGTFFEDGLKSSKWSNSSSSNWTKANFENSTGTAYLKLRLKKALKINFHSIVHSKGNLLFEVVDENKTILYSSRLNSEENNFSINFPNKGEYQLRWKSTLATGNYFLEWKE